MVQIDPIQSYLSLKIGLPPILKAGSSCIFIFHIKHWWKFFFQEDEMNKVYTEGNPNLSVSVAYRTVPVFREGPFRSTAQRAVIFWPVSVIFI